MKNLLGPLQASLQTWWSGISQREQRLVLMCGGLLFLGVLYWGILQPLQQRSDAAKARIVSEQQLLQWVQSTADDIVALRGQGGVARTSQTLNQVITNSTRQFNIELIRVQPRGDMMQVWVQPLPFSQLVAWIAYLKEKQGVDVEYMDLDRGKVSGVVEVKRLQLKRGTS
ncbi:MULTISPECIES: type II secretion system protein M [Vibrio]|uniref:type II secretion system protein M n=1 Tax=Vibrio TaxID=662 RepID=UPI0013026C50|nr:type II secretion system protein M [Vibrio furnissii]MCG6213617.1 type II secretion system protein M [Vibrio furnissii]MCG6235589.1 type II secretion system protein M [Vibrio furnissii]MCG6261121.1 type II secretion system protein M [Vibrio furnissii]MCG6269199.1 type II secretion system protein M [Vibrio furnissii]UHJ60102.1 type II secretion system protein M [Vibrio furnissii]